MIQKIIYSIIFTLISFSFSYAVLEFSKNPVILKWGIGLDGHCTNPEFIDLDNNGDFDIIFERDDDLNYPVYFQNIGTNKSPEFIRDNNMFLWLSGIDYGHIRILDLDQDEDFDLIIITYSWFYSSIDSSFVITFLNNGTPQAPVWDQNPDTIYTSSGEILEYTLINIMDDTLPQVIISIEQDNAFSVKLFIQKNDSLTEVPNYFPINYYGGITRLEFLPIFNDSRFYLVYNYRDINMSVAGYNYYTNLYSNTGTNMNPQWKLLTQWSGQYRFLPQLTDTNKYHLYYQEYEYWGVAVCGIYRILKIDSLGNSEFVYSQFWHQGSIGDLASFDYKKDGKMDLIIKYSAGWEPDPNFAYASLNLFQCVFDLDSCIILGNVYFDTSFSTPIMYAGSGTTFDYFDIDNDGDTDQLFHARSDVVVMGFSRLYINTHNDTVPSWNIYYDLPYNYPNYFPVEAMYSLVDIDLDTDKDLIIEYYKRESRNRLGFLENIGTPENFIFSDSIKNLLDFSGHPTSADLDGDKDPDMILCYWDNTRYIFDYFRNDSKNDSILFTKIDSVLPKINDVFAPCLMDVDGDGDNDLVVSTYPEGLYFIENISPLSINNLDTNFPQIFELKQNYPNPFNSYTIITFKMPQTARVNISLYNILGAQVRNLYSGLISGGIHQIKLNADGLSSGLYFYVLESGDVNLVRKCLLIK